jgi:hypothetical protein
MISRLLSVSKELVCAILKEIDSKKMASRKLKFLSFMGSVLVRVVELLLKIFVPKICSQDVQYQQKLWRK